MGRVAIKLMKIVGPGRPRPMNLNLHVTALTSGVNKFSIQLSSFAENIIVHTHANWVPVRALNRHITIFHLQRWLSFYL
ncbi:hypothetical protein L6452_16338 [Arctium lappa]|uniref:Uncharacterized protein n=1 Tax=Arctium lappa TaxID=4217 RepID=A0ACB9C0H1_ARCLA|nr:hypothetical protein L6452_16338 [Arctium lappa]